MNKLTISRGIENQIYFIRGQKVMLDNELANLYGVPTKSLKRAVNRNRARFPNDFMFILTKKEYRGLRYESGTLEITRPCNLVANLWSALVGYFQKPGLLFLELEGGGVHAVAQVGRHRSICALRCAI